MVTLVASQQQGCWVDSDWRPFRLEFIVHFSCTCGSSLRVLRLPWVRNVRLTSRSRRECECMWSVLWCCARRQTAVLSRMYTSQGGGKLDEQVYISPCFMRHTTYISNVDLLADIQFRCAANLLNASSEGIPIWFIAGEFWCKRKFCSETLQCSWTVHYNSVVNGTTKTGLHCDWLIIDAVIHLLRQKYHVCSLNPFDFSGHQQWQRHQRWSTEKIGTNRSMPTFGPPFLAGPLLKHQAVSHQNHETPRESYPQGRRERKKNKTKNKTREDIKGTERTCGYLNWAFPKKQNLPEDSEQRVWKRQRKGATFLYQIRERSLERKWERFTTNNPSGALDTQ